MPYYDFANKMFDFVDQYEMDYKIMYYQGKVDSINSPSFEKLCCENMEFFAPFIKEIEKKMNNEDFKTNFLEDWKKKECEEKKFQIKKFSGRSEEEDKLAQASLEKTFSERIQLGYDQVIEEIKSYSSLSGCNYKVTVLGYLYNFYRNFYRKESLFQLWKGTNFEKFYCDKKKMIKESLLYLTTAKTITD